MEWWEDVCCQLGEDPLHDSSKHVRTPPWSVRESEDEETLKHTTTSMFSWWGASPSPAEDRCPVRRTVKTRQAHIEVIGGPSRTNGHAAGGAPRSPICGPPRLPPELVTHVLLLAAELLVQNHGGSRALLELARVDRSAHHAIVTAYILSDLQLDGTFQVKAFARDLQRNVLGLQSQVKRVKRLAVRRGGDLASSQYALFSNAEHLAHFEKATLEPLQVILSHCTNLESLSLDMPARVLDDRQEKSKKAGLGRSLKELITLLSVYGGDLNEALWHPGSLSLPRWNNLTHLQLHGPRFRMTSLTATAISQLPSLTHLALIMPLLVQPNSVPSGAEYGSMERRVDYAKDALGRHNVLQILIDALGHRLQKLLLVCHDVEAYVGSIQKLGSWFRTLHWRCSMSREDYDRQEGASLVLVTVKPRNPLQTTPHPSLYSKWMLQRADRGVHWHWTESEGFTGHDRSEGLDLVYSVERWKMPVVFDRSSETGAGLDDRWPNVSVQGGADLATARRWLGIDQGDAHHQESESRSPSPFEELSGIDNLD